MHPEPVPVTVLKGVGPSVARRLATLGIQSVVDLLFHLPVRYQDRSRIVPLGALEPGDEVMVEGGVIHSEVVYRRRRALLVELEDHSERLTLRFFHFSRAQVQALAPGSRVRCFGEVRSGPRSLEMIHPEYTVVDGEAAEPMAGSLTPIYPTTEGLHQISLRKLSQQALAWLEDNSGALRELVPPDCLPAPLRLGLAEALTTVHRPPVEALPQQGSGEDQPARLRLAFEELLAHQLGLVRLREQLRLRGASRIEPPGRLWRRLEGGLGFEPTAAQQRVIAEIRADLRRGHPMLRLVQGDVGSGKTLVALAACVDCIEAGLQAALMAPTELLAEQHLHSFLDWVAPLDIDVAWLMGRQRAAERKAMLRRVVEGEAPLVVGTHALFQDDVAFQALGLVVVDEQHRFGVHQRLALGEKGRRGECLPHQLIMTATPIPRTLAMTAYADLDCSVIDELPPGRSPVTTVAIADGRREEVLERVAEACASGRQAYWVCTLVEESEALQCQAAEATAATLSAALPQLSVGLVHGRLSAAEKEAVMGRFKDRRIDLLVATTVIEVGVDVPNASLMVIENAERLGLAQLHQLRGRVGRGTVHSSCVLMYRPPLSQNARQRIDALRQTGDGFEIARIDLDLRGPGEVLGTRQTGMLQFRIADLLRDQDLLPGVQRAAQEMITRHPEAVDPLMRRWVGESLRFGQV